MSLISLLKSPYPASHYIFFSNGASFISSERKGTPEERRRSLIYFYQAFVEDLCSQGVEKEVANSYVRMVWSQVTKNKVAKDLPSIVAHDGFLKAFARAEYTKVGLLREIKKNLLLPVPESAKQVLPIEFGATVGDFPFYDVKATPSGIFPKISSAARKKQDFTLLKYVQSDLDQVQKIKDLRLRKLITLAILCHGASYRELQGKILELPSFTSLKMIPYEFEQHFIWEGVKTISGYPLKEKNDHPGLYLCQGTEIWPSQPSMLGSLFANLGKEGCATEPYAYSWRQIHRHLKQLYNGGPLPIAAGHSMGGALATQIALYSHTLIDSACAFNPPVVEERDYRVYEKLSPSIQQKLQVFANLDDIPFWRIGSKVIGNVHVLLSEKRWQYRPLKIWELLTIFPFLLKFTLNLVYSFPAHQNIYLLTSHYLIVPLSKVDIEKENAERVTRADHLFFIPKLYNPAKLLISFARKHFTWEKYEDYLLSQIEIIDLHLQDLTNQEDGCYDEELKELENQKKLLKTHLKQFRESKKKL